MTRLYVAISHHGYGHLAQVAPVLDALHGLAPDIELIVRSALPRAVLAARLAMPFSHLDAASDCNLSMLDAVRVDLPASLAAYQFFHRDWTKRVEAEAARLEALRIDLVFSNVGYLPLAAAQRAGIPCAAMCSINWADIFAHYLGRAAGAGEILATMRAAYAGARVFFRPEPSMPMADLANAIDVPPVAGVGRHRRGELNHRLGVSAEIELVLLGMGGIPYRPPVENWPLEPSRVFLAPDAWQARRPDIRPLAACGMSFQDVLASCDALVTKPGYGSYVESAVGGVPALFIPRPDWPEAPYLNDWLIQNARAMKIGEVVLSSGALGTPLATLLALPAKPSVQAGGAEVVARHVLKSLK